MRCPCIKLAATMSAQLGLAYPVILFAAGDVTNAICEQIPDRDRGWRAPHGSHS